MSSAFRLTEAERTERYNLLVRATTLPEPPMLTEAGLRLLLDAATAPQAPEALPEQLRPQLQRLITAGLADSDGRLVPQAADIVKVIQQPAIWLQIDAIAGHRPGAWKTWLNDQQAVIIAQSGATDEYALQTVMPGWVPLAALRWLGIGPRDTLTGRPVLPMTALLRWLDEQDTALPGDDPALTAIWAQRGQLWAIDVEPGSGRALVLDAAAAGLWLVTPEDTTAETAEDAEEGADGAVLVPLPPRAFWHLLLTFIACASEAASTGKARGDGHAANGSSARRNDGLL